MKRTLIILVVLAIIGGGVFLYLKENGHTVDTLLNTPSTIDLTVDCSSVENLLLASTVYVTVDNMSSRTHENVTVRITAYDKKGNVVKQKETTFLRTLNSNSSMSKPISLPTKAVECDCVISSSDPN